MKLPHFIVATVLLACIGADTLAQHAVEPWTGALVQKASDAVANSVVQIEMIGGLDQVDGNFAASGPTTGLIVDDQGHIVTSSYVLAQNPSSILVRSPSGERLSATIVSRDESRNLVLLKVQPTQDMVAATVVPRDEIFVGQAALAVGKTVDQVRLNVSTGIVSATIRIWGKAIQSDAKISPANFGGPLVDLRGRVLGVLVPLQPDGSNAIAGAQWYDSGIGFAIPLEDILNRLDELRSGKNLVEGKSGLKFKSTMGYASPPIVAMSLAGSPAAKAGIPTGVRIVHINGQEIKSVVQAQHALRPLYAGDRVEIVYSHGDSDFTKEMILVDELRPFRHPYLGILPGRNDTGIDGVVIGELLGDESNAGVLRPGDRIVHVDIINVNDRDRLNMALIQFEVGTEVEVGLVRDGVPTKVNVALREFDAGVQWVQGNEPTDFAGIQEIDLKSVQVPAFSNQCYAYVPENSQRPSSVIVWVPEAGKIDATREVQPWKELCDRHNVVLIIPESQESDQWQIEESEFIVKAVDEIKRRHEVDDWKVGIAGKGSGSAAAVVTALQNRPVFRGIACVETAFPSMALRFDAEPLQRQLVLLLTVGEEGEVAPEMDAVRERLQEQGFPVGIVQQSAWSSQSIAAVLIAWVQTLDRM